MPIATLDYPKTKLVLETTNPIEQTYRAHACAKEPWTLSFIEAIPDGALFWDVGANVGPYTLVAVSRGLDVLAIEPGFNNYASLCRNLAMNQMLDRCLVLCLALGETGRLDWLHYQDARSGAGSHVLGGERKQFFHKQRIPVWRWDDLAAWMGIPTERPQYAKLDVDGGELAALKGAPGILTVLRGLIVEMHAEQEAEMTALLTANGLRLAERFDERDGKPLGGIAYGRFERG